MTDYLTNFCKNGDPNGARRMSTWAPASETEKRVQTMGKNEPRMAKAPMLRMIKTMFTNKAVGE